MTFLRCDDLTRFVLRYQIQMSNKSFIQRPNLSMFLKTTQKKTLATCKKDPTVVDRQIQPNRIYYKIPYQNLFTGQAFWKTSATILTDTEGSILRIKMHGGWKPDTVADVYGK